MKRKGNSTAVLKGIVEQSPNKTRHIKAIHCTPDEKMSLQIKKPTKAHCMDRVIDPGHLYK